MRNARPLRRWLLLCMALVAMMVLIGGLTRLTESGLSIVKWKLVTGTLPPLSAESWNQEFTDYQASPQYKLVNHDFSLADFQHIYWLEYLHRLIGRLVGLAIFLPFLYFLARRQLGRFMVVRSLQMFFLVALQGTVGWVMVASGLHNEPRVEPLKLALHLSLAFSLFLLMLWTYWQLSGRTRFSTSAPIAFSARALFLVIFAQIIFGALVAGLRAGLSYNTYPLMDGQWVPDGLWTLSPWWRNHLESILTVQFQHRMGALVVLAIGFAIVATAWRKTVALHRELRILLWALLLQFSLGVATLLSQVNHGFASTHQLGALVLLSAALNLVYRFSVKNPLND